LHIVNNSNAGSNTTVTPLDLTVSTTYDTVRIDGPSSSLNGQNVVMTGAQSSVIKNLYLGYESYITGASPLDLTVTNDCFIYGYLWLAGAGSAAGTGTSPGASDALANAAGGGGGYGGYGGTGSTTYAGGTTNYGSILSPASAGSGGGNGNGVVGGAGGGILSLNVTTTLTINGTISANGSNGVNGLNSNGGGGSGGSILLNVGTLTGNSAGIITANGGNGGTGGGFDGGGGGGGRIAYYYTNNSFPGNITAFGGTGYNTGAAGTIYNKQNIANGVLHIVNNSNAGSNTTVTPLDLTVSTTYDTVRIDGPSSSLNGQNVVMTGAQSSVIKNLYLGYESYITGASPLDLTVTNDCFIYGYLWLAGAGSAAASGASPGISDAAIGAAGGGGGYGGIGGAGTGGYAGGGTSGLSNQPIIPGSGGGNGNASSGGAGGGALQLKVTTTLTINGTINANGTNGGPAASSGGGGGSGGSILLCANTIAGTSGQVTANGGNGWNTGGGIIGGGGGGGRIAKFRNTETYTGTYSVAGGTGNVAGGAGTLYSDIDANCTFSALPITLIDFYCTTSSNLIKLDWSTASEINNDHFTIERSVDGLTFNTLTTIKGAGNSISTKYYKYLDENPVNGANYYRLSQTDYDGHIEYFNITECSEGNNDYNVYPNPTNGKLFLTLPNSSNLVSVEIEIYDIVGRLLWTQNAQSNQLINIDISQLPSAPYIIRVISEGNQLFTGKIILLH